MVQAQYLSSDSDYLRCKKKECKKHDASGKCVLTTCGASLSFHVVNIRSDIEFVMFGGGFGAPCIMKRSESVSFANPKKPLYGHISSIDSTATSVRNNYILSITITLFNFSSIFCSYIFTITIYMYITKNSTCHIFMLQFDVSRAILCFLFDDILTPYGRELIYAINPLFLCCILRLFKFRVFFAFYTDFEATLV